MGSVGTIMSPVGVNAGPEGTDMDEPVWHVHDQ